MRKLALSLCLAVSFSVQAQNFPRFLVSPLGVLDKMTNLYENYMYQMNRDFPTIELGDCKFFSDLYELCISRDVQENRIIETLLFYTNGSYRDQITFSREGENLQPSTDDDLFNLRFKVSGDESKVDYNLFNRLAYSYAQEKNEQFASIWAVQDKGEPLYFYESKDDEQWIRRYFTNIPDSLPNLEILLYPGPDLTYYKMSNEPTAIDLSLFMRFYAMLVLNAFEGCDQGTKSMFVHGLNWPDKFL